ncbi:hypothetical protein GEMRC1_003865 [Eukaryota sp. GEM-RC1]
MSDNWLIDSAANDDDDFVVHTNTNSQLPMSLEELPASHKERIRVVIRKRPLSKKEIQKGEQDITTVESQNTVAVHEPKVKVDLTKYIERHRFVFDEVFDDDMDNQDLYQRTAQPLIPFVFAGGRATCFAYGQTGAGKTFTMMGNGTTIPGLYVLAARDIFALLHNPQYHGFCASVSFFEIYAGKLFDLLNGKKRLFARADHKDNVCISGIQETIVQDEATLLQVIDFGLSSRSTGATGVNDESSRSHAILQICLVERKSSRVHGKFSFIDLAGSERAADTKCSDRKTRVEGADINTSLLSLKECIRALDKAATHLPFRGSKLTMVLKDSFIGDARTVMIAAISPNTTSGVNTLNTLRYAFRVKELKSGGGVGDGHCEEKMVVGGHKERRSLPPRPIAVAPSAPAIKPKRKAVQFEWRDAEILDVSESEDKSESEDPLLKTHSDMLQTILDQGEDIVSAHRQQVDSLMELLKEDMVLLNSVESPESEIDQYVQRLDSILERKLDVVTELKAKVSSFRSALEDEEKLSQSFSRKR